MADKVTIAGISANIVTPEEAERAHFVACCTTGMPSPFDDNVHTSCAICGCGIFHRPTVPQAPLKACIPCIAKFSGGGEA